MKKENVLNFNNFLSTLKLNKFDREIRAAIITNSFLAKKIVKEFDETVQEARNRYFDGLDAEIELLVLYREKFKNATPEERTAINEECVRDCYNILRAEKELGEYIQNLQKEEVTESFVKFDREMFVDQCVDGNIDITVELLETLDGLFN